MQRRTLLKSAATATAGLGAGALLAHSTRTAQATATVSTDPLSIAGADQTTEDGQVSEVYLSVSGDWSYQVPSGKDPDLWQVVAMVGTQESDRGLIAAQTDEALYLDGSGGYALEGTVFDSDAFARADFAAPGPGETTTQDIWVGVSFSLFNPEEDVIALAETSDTATVKVTEAEYKVSEHGSLTGDGEIVIVE